MYQKRKAVENTLILVIDIICIWLCFGIAYWCRFKVMFGTYETGDQLWQIAFVTIIYSILHLFGNFNNHFFQRGYFEEFVTIIRELSIFSILWIVVLFLIHKSSDLSRLVYGYFIISGTCVIYTARILFKQFMIKIFKTSKYSNRLLVVADSSSINLIVKNLIEYNEWSRILVGIVLTDQSMLGEWVCGFPVVADKESLIEYVVHNNVDEVFISSASVASEDHLEKWIFELENMGVIVDVNIDMFDIASSGKKTLNRVGKYAVVTFARNIFSNREMALKRLIDIIGSLVGMVILGVTTIFLAPIIKLESPGPVFFGQTRIGKNGRIFTCYKFRSMYQDAEQRKKDLMKQNEVKGLMFKLEDDPRITKVGKFIRKTSIDEFPQFWNVLKGDMSLVGTRPPTVDEYERYEVKHKCRLSMTPGLTGLWQISGRSDIKDFDEVVKLDMKYIDDWSILKDIKILVLTIWVVLTGKGSR
ncbi:sugar transferase [Candidatus Galacturonibacter soehngenii]|uniref:Sugar transferase n=1 Tax=Candidatus Galacturonatibacter soehngenii TaxID=2307010 RepID=A0A7V7UBX8_9FIRM|nr:sugar transferase [Candidatus Galacturonibacter soehngenii]KAB1438240.1 sugar transferase [Candidatus Galacturonibacter soehngenii]